ncbi:hypothetical protein SADUNF_Sadunf16G0241400 [Salix dunnii]|uniref:Uncharacterized protein n=1 Tax=Salix dunnii TaxID=1413687 RepID=A0A835JD00_9ROSI|nr:hypothetical protein SADUNF_Sadunf16G0241400 [Salix dunnii]
MGKKRKLYGSSEMIRLGMKPNGVTFVGLLHACSHMGLIDEAVEINNDHGKVAEYWRCILAIVEAETVITEIIR